MGNPTGVEDVLQFALGHRQRILFLVEELPVTVVVASQKVGSATVSGRQMLCEYTYYTSFLVSEGILIVGLENG